MHCNNKSISFLILTLLAALALLCKIAAAQDMPSEQSARAAMVFNFLKFTDFPSEVIAKNSGIRLCFSVRDPRQAEALTALSGHKIKGRELTVADFATQNLNCHVLYIDSRQQWNAMAEHPALRRALTISAYPGFAQDGGMIEIAVQSDGIRFDINLAEGRRAGLHFSPQMLRLARRIHD